METAIVSFAIERISDLLIHEAVFLSGVRDEVERLKFELERMQSFLKDTDRKQEQDERLRNRVAQIRALAYDAEDVIDNFILKVAHQEGFQGFIKRFTSIFTKPFHLHKTGEQIKAMQIKLEDISKSLPVYEIPGEGEASSSTSWMQQQRWSRRTYPRDIEDVVGLEGITKNALAQLKTEEEDRRHVVVSIVGMGGIGKTTLAKNVYHHNDVKQHFDCFVWAFISQQCMAREVLHDVLIKVLSPSNEERKKIDRMRQDELVETLFDALGEKRYLVVFDDIWKREDWDLFKPAFPRGKKGSKILFTTRNREVALHADPFNSPIELQPLTIDESWKLLCKKAFPRHTMEPDARSREFESLGREMVKRCGGLPLAVVALGGLLASKSSRSQWEMVHRNIQQEGGAVKGILALSYNDLPYYLKPCFLSLGYYPEDWEISKKELIRIWFAEGFLSASMRSGRKLEDAGEKFLEELIDRCLVQVSKRDRTGMGVKTFRIHDLLRDLCVDKAQEENFLKIIQPSLLVETSGDSLDVTLSKSMPRRLAIHPSKRYVCLKGKDPNIRSVLLFQNESLRNLHISECKSFRLLRVLYLVKWNADEWHVSTDIGKLLHLRYLRLECNFGKIILPRSVGKLKSLHTLHVQLYGFGSIIIPNVVSKLEGLRHILLFDGPRKVFRSGTVMRFPVRGVLKCIETLKYIRIQSLVETDGVLSLNNIGSLGVIFERSKYVEPILKAVVQSNSLHSLYIRMAYPDQSYPDLEALSQCHHLSKLFIHGKIKVDPRHHHHHHVLKFVPPNIVKLTLWECWMEQDPMVVLEKLPHLRILHLWGNSYLGTKLKCSANGFPQLHSLVMMHLNELEEWQIEEGAMPRLQSLLLNDVRKLGKLPEGLRYLTALQEMELESMKRSLVERIQVIDGRQGDDFSYVSHIPSIQVTNTREG